jgi:chloramphenicol O-acetyltransferase
MKTEPRCIPEIEEAIDLLEEFETQLPDVSNIDLFVTATQILDGYIEDNPNTPYTNFVHNIKMSYTRRILQELMSIDNSEIETWFSVVITFAIVKEEFEALSTANPVYREEYDDFLKEWAGTYELKQLMAKVFKEKSTCRSISH